MKRMFSLFAALAFIVSAVCASPVTVSDQVDNTIVVCATDVSDVLHVNGEVAVLFIMSAPLAEAPAAVLAPNFIKHEDGVSIRSSFAVGSRATRLWGGRAYSIDNQYHKTIEKQLPWTVEHRCQTGKRGILNA